MKRCILVLLASLLKACTSIPPVVTARWAGTYEVVDKIVVPDSNSPTGVTLATEASDRKTRVKALVEGSRLDARVGHGFGVIYRVPPETQDGLRVIVQANAGRYTTSNMSRNSYLASGALNFGGKAQDSTAMNSLLPHDA
jgi:hypothetical protein